MVVVYGASSMPVGEITSPETITTNERAMIDVNIVPHWTKGLYIQRRIVDLRSSYWTMECRRCGDVIVLSVDTLHVCRVCSCMEILTLWQTAQTESYQRPHWPILVQARYSKLRNEPGKLRLLNEKLHDVHRRTLRCITVHVVLLCFIISTTSAFQCMLEPRISMMRYLKDPQRKDPNHE